MADVRHTQEVLNSGTDTELISPTVCVLIGMQWQSLIKVTLAINCQ